jgi:hypothetical protein
VCLCMRSRSDSFSAPRPPSLVSLFPPPQAYSYSHSSRAAPACAARTLCFSTETVELVLAVEQIGKTSVAT